MDLFDDVLPRKHKIALDAYFLRGFALMHESQLLLDIQQVINQAPVRTMLTPMGLMRVKTTSCGEWGWDSDEAGYRYSRVNPSTGQSWPSIPDYLICLAQQAAREAGFKDFLPDSCLINQYQIGAGMGLHQDKNERDFSQPIVSVSLGISAVFQFGGLKRSDRTVRIPVHHGDVLVWGATSRLCFHGVMPIKASCHPVLGSQRINLTFRKAG